MRLHEHAVSKLPRFEYLARAILCSGLLLSFAGSADAAEILAVHPNGAPAWIEHRLAKITLPRSSPRQSAEEYYAALTRALEAGTRNVLARHLGATGHEEIHLEKVAEDESGRTHLSFTQRVAGLEVVGSGFRIHLNSGRVQARGRSGRHDLNRIVEGFNGRFYPHGREYERSRLNPMEFDRAFAIAMNQLYASGQAVDDPELLMLGDGDELELAYRVTAVLTSGGVPEIVYVGATDGRLLRTEPTMIPGLPPANESSSMQDPLPKSPFGLYKQRFIARTSLATNFFPPNDWFERCDETVWLPLPGFSTSPACPTTDMSAKRAQENQIRVYRYYANEHGQHSYNDANADLDSIVSWGLVVPEESVNNAFWLPKEKRMYYGAGDGSWFVDFTFGLDVAAHEFTHAITEDLSGLVYARQSGALNEAISDMFAAAIEAADDGQITPDSWLIGEDVIGPDFPGGAALRYMNNPGLDGYSPDHFSNLLYPDPCTPHKGNDYCGVHHNSGIPNLAFYLLTQGGQHPTGASPVVVSGIGIEKAAKIFYVANRDYLNPDSDFSAARLATEAAATLLYDGATVQSVNDAWAAVGVTT